MGQFSSKTSKAQPSQHDKAVLDLKIQRDRLHKYQKHLLKVIERETEIARRHLQNGDKKRALLVLKRKRYQTGLIEQTEQQLLNVEQLVNSIEFALVEQKVVEGLRKGNDALKSIQDQMKLEDVEKLMEDTADAIAYQKEIDALLGQNMTAEVDEEVEAELDKLLQTEADQVKLPSVPATELPSKDIIEDQKPEQKEKKKLVALES